MGESGGRNIRTHGKGGKRDQDDEILEKKREGGIWCVEKSDGSLNSIRVA